MDPSSRANITSAVSKHIHLAVSADFQARSISGTCTVSVCLLRADVDEIVFDTKTMAVTAVRVNGESANFALGDPHEAYGTALTVTVPESFRGRNATVQVAIDYATRPEATGVQWMSPEQTTGGKHPYLYTQCEAIHARSLLPCQDTPAAKISYSAEITVPAGLTALMSATGDGSGPAKDGSGTTFKFKQERVLPSYLFALVVGNLEGRDVSDRCRVWSEPEVIEKAAWEFAETEKFLTTAEKLAGPYEWGRYDILVTPAGYVFGGMENVQLTFVTPTLLAGDRSLTNVIAHEIAHSWSGNLVTNRVWESFWLNEGWTVYLERKIVSALSDNPKATFDFEAGIGWRALKGSVEDYGEHHEFTTLVPFIDNQDPDDAFSSVPYEKGFNLLYHLEQLVGGEEVFLPFMRAYFANFKFRSVDTEQFLSFFEGYFAAKGIETNVDWNQWLHTPGMPELPQRDTSLAAAATALATKWAEGDGAGATAADLDSFSARQTVVFLENLLDHTPFTAEKIDALQAAYDFNASGNAEIRFRWQTIRLRSKDERVFPAVSAFLAEQGRMKFTRPLFKDLAACSDKGKEEAVKTFANVRNMYHPIGNKMIAKDLGVA